MLGPDRDFFVAVDEAFRDEEDSFRPERFEPWRPNWDGPFDFDNVLSPAEQVAHMPTKFNAEVLPGTYALTISQQYLLPEGLGPAPCAAKPLFMVPNLLGCRHGFCRTVDHRRPSGFVDPYRHGDGVGDRQRHFSLRSSVTACQRLKCAAARRLGLIAAMAMRVVLLFTIGWLTGLTEPLFALDLAIVEPSVRDSSC